MRRECTRRGRRRTSVATPRTRSLPEEAFFAQLYLYVRDREDIIRRVAAPQLGTRPSDARFCTEPARTSALHAAEMGTIEIRANLDFVEVAWR